MKWPASITLLRHAQSAYNELRSKKEADPDYTRFKRAYNKDPASDEARSLAGVMAERHALGVGDYETPLSQIGERQCLETSKHMWAKVPEPDIVLVSPYLRTKRTFELVRQGRPDRFSKSSIIIDERIREQEHGLSLLYSDWRIFNILHPEQRKLRELQGPYWYQYPQGESVAQVRDRIRLITSTIIREYAGLHVLLVTHHLTILSARANFERLSPEDFMRLDEHEKPVNCGVTLYRGDPRGGRNGKLELQCYNRQFY